LDRQKVFDRRKASPICTGGTDCPFRIGHQEEDVFEETGDVSISKEPPPSDGDVIPQITRGRKNPPASKKANPTASIRRGRRLEQPVGKYNNPIKRTSHLYRMVSHPNISNRYDVLATNKKDNKK